MKRLTILLMLLLAYGYISANKFTVVIDAGHGGRDPGATRGKTLEKNINLAVALNLGKLIENNNKDVKVIYTRKTDVFLDLDKRAAIANKAKANLFISIHTNSTEAKATTAHGADTYILGLARSAENMRVAQRENSVITLEENYQQKYENFDPKSPESYIIFEFMANKYMEQSLQLAGFVQDNFRTSAKRKDNGVRQAGFLVLRETACPSILIELGFINNSDEAKYLSSAIGQRTMASAIYAAFKQYKREMDRRQASPLAAEDAPVTKTSEPATTPVLTQTETPQKETQVQSTPSQTSSGTTFINKPKTTPQIVSQPKEETKEEPLKATDKVDTKPVSTKQTETKTTTGSNKVNASELFPEYTQTATVAPNLIEYRVQIMTNARKYNLNTFDFKGLSPVNVYEDGGVYKYTYGSTTDRNESRRLLREARAKYPDAFIVEFKDGKRIK